MKCFGLLHLFYATLLALLICKGVSLPSTPRRSGSYRSSRRSTLRQQRNSNDLPHNSPIAPDVEGQGEGSTQQNNDGTLDDDAVTDAGDNADGTLGNATTTEEASIGTKQTEKKGLSELKIRTLSSVVTLAGIVALIKFTPDDTGLKGLIVLCQILLYTEVTSALGITGGLWALLTHMQSSLLPFFLKGREQVFRLITFGMIADHICVMVMSSRANLGAALYNFAGSHVAALATVKASSYWFSTMAVFGSIWVIYPALLVILNDTVAYLFGKLFGKHPIFPTISPNKTWEGFLSAAVATIAASGILGNKLVSPEIRVLNYYLVGAYVSFVAPFGGFLGSMVKRHAGIKDFGKIIPGHGGMVDRLDCQLMTAPFVYLYLDAVANTP